MQAAELLLFDKVKRGTPWLIGWLIESSGIALSFNLILSVYKFDFILPFSLNLCFIIDLVLS